MRVGDSMHRCRTTRWPVPSFSDRWESRSHAGGSDLSRVWADYLGRLRWEWFVSLTFDPKRVFPVSRELGSREAFWWCGTLGHIYRRPAAWVYVVERSPSGAWHAHALIIGIGAPRWLAAAEAWRTRNGMIDIQPVADIGRVTLYSTKTLADGGEIVLSDTLVRYKRRIAEASTADLYPRPDPHG